MLDLFIHLFKLCMFKPLNTLSLPEFLLECHSSGVGLLFFLFTAFFDWNFILEGRVEHLAAIIVHDSVRNDDNGTPKASNVT